MIQRTFPTADCSGPPSYFNYGATACSINTGACTVVRTGSVRMDCVASAPSVPSNFVAQTSYTGSSCLTVLGVTAAVPSTCIALSASSSLMMSCSGTAVSVLTFLNDSCTGQHFTTTAGPSCAIAVGGSAYAIGSCTTANAQFMVQRVFSTADCTGPPSFINYMAAACSIGTGTCSSVRSGSMRIDCIASAPSVPSNFVAQTSYTSSSCSTVLGVDAALPSTCIATSATSSLMMSCSGSAAQLVSFSDDSCTKLAFAITAGSTCAIPSGGTEFAIGSCAVPASGGSCFHESTVIRYRAEDLTIADLEKHADCSIPHKLVSEGVRIETTSGLFD